MTTEQQDFYDSCLLELNDRHGKAVFYLPNLERYVKATFKAGALLDEIMDEEATIKLTNHTGHTNDASSPKVRMFALFNEQAMKLGKDLGLNLHQGKAGRPSKKKKSFGNNMKIAK